MFGCSNQSVQNFANSNKEPSNNSIEKQTTDKLPKTIDIIIGISNGYIISIGKNGEYKYFAGDYIPDVKNKISSDEPLPNFDIKFVKKDEIFKEKSGRFPVSKINKISKLILDEKKLFIQEQINITDQYTYQIYLDKKLVAYGYSTVETGFSDNLKQLFKLIQSEIKFELSGRA